MQTLAPELIHGISVIPIVISYPSTPENPCVACVFESWSCDDISCTPPERADGREVYFVPDTKVSLPFASDSSTASDGSTASYYELPEGAAQLQDLIAYRNMNGQDAEIFRALYRKGHCPHSSLLREAKKALFYAQAEVARLEKYGE